jgi:hypothetical protein
MRRIGDLDNVRVNESGRIVRGINLRALGLLLSTESGTISSRGRDDGMIVITRLPTHRNDGSKVKRRELRAILTLIRGPFGGYSLEGPFQGAWVADDGRVYEETSYRLEVLISPKRLQEARDLFVRIGSRLGQRAIYFEVRDGGEIIDLE